MASDASIPASAKKATGTDGASANSTANPEAATAATASIRNTRCMPRVARRVATSGANDQPDQNEHLDRRHQKGSLDHIEVEGLLVLERGQGGEAGDGGGQEGQGEEDPAEHADLPDHPPGLPEGRRAAQRV